MAEHPSDWRPNGRPQSTIARTFSADLNDAFKMDSNLAGLAQSIEQKKQAVSSQSQELEALEARLRETEERLKQQQTKISSHPDVGGRQSSPHRRQPIGTTFGTYPDDIPQAAFPTLPGAPSSSSQAQQPSFQGLLAGNRSRRYQAEDHIQGARDGNYTHGATRETASQSGQWPPPGTRFE